MSNIEKLIVAMDGSSYAEGLPEQPRRGFYDLLKSAREELAAYRQLVDKVRNARRLLEREKFLTEQAFQACEILDAALKKAPS